MVDIDFSELIRYACLDKKNKNEEITFIIPINVGQVKTFSLKREELKKELKSIGSGV